MTMADPIQDFVDLIGEQQTTLVDQRAVFTNEVVNHLLELPGLAALFDTEESKSLLGAQIGALVEAQARTKAQPAPEIPPPPPLPTPEPQSGE
jgi:hypothetical protein